MSDTRSYSSLVTHETSGYVGFANLPNRVHRKSEKKGFEFTLMVAGESGLGKSTLIDSLFLTDLYPDRVVPTAEERIKRTVQVRCCQMSRSITRLVAKLARLLADIIRGECGLLFSA